MLGFGHFDGTEGLGAKTVTRSKDLKLSLLVANCLTLFDLYCPIKIEALKVSSKIGKMLKKPVSEVVLDMYLEEEKTAFSFWEKAIVLNFTRILSAQRSLRSNQIGLPTEECCFFIFDQ